MDDPSQGCPVDAETWRGLQVCEEQPREGYDREAFGSAYSSLEDDIIDMLPRTMRAGGQVYTPYSCLAFDIRADGTAATDIEHIVALAEAHDSGIADVRRRDIAADLDNLTIADPRVNRTEKSDRDAGEWTPARHDAWFAERVIAVKLEYELSVDPRERDALEALLGDGGAQLSCVDAATTSPTVAISSDAGAPVTGPFSITVAFSEPVTGFELEDLVVGNGTASELQGNNASYMATITPATSGTVTVAIAAGAARERGRQPERGGGALNIPSWVEELGDAGTAPARTRAGVDTTRPVGRTKPIHSTWASTRGRVSASTTSARSRERDWRSASTRRHANETRRSVPRRHERMIEHRRSEASRSEADETMTTWNACPAVERDPEKVSGVWVFRGTRVPVSALFENLRDGATIDQFLELFPGVEREQLLVVLDHELDAALGAVEWPARFVSGHRYARPTGSTRVACTS